MSLHLEVQTAIVKVNKYAVSESGDTVEVVERPHGGLSVVVVDGQRSGKSAKAISNIVVRKAISLLADGVRDGAVARATHDYLRTERGGRVSAELSIVSVDLVTNTLVISRNARCPVLLRINDALRWLDEPAEAVGIYRHTKPSITELALTPLTTVIVFTDGILNCRQPPWHNT
jgi:serine phosphatase RsbU (regulator of sigma subunit)